MAEAKEEKNKARKRSSSQSHGKDKRKKQAVSSLSLAIPGEDCVKLKVDKKLLEEFKLVGRSEFPNSLLHYVDDRDRLLDEVFSIFSREDVRGLLPDILKRVKMKKIRALCSHQLSLIDRESLEKIITGERDNLATSREAPGNDETSRKEAGLTGTKPSSSLFVSEQLSESSNAGKERIHNGSNLQEDHQTECLPPVSVKLTPKAGDQSTGATKSGTASWHDNKGPANQDVPLTIVPSIVDAVDIELLGHVYESPQCSEQSCCTSNDDVLAGDDSQTHAHPSGVATQGAPTSSTMETLLREKLLGKAKPPLKLNSLEATPELKPQNVVDSSDAERLAILEQKMREKALRSLLLKKAR